MRPGIAALKSLALLRAFDDDALAALDQASDRTGMGPGDVLFRADDILRDLPVLIWGQIAAIHPSGGDDAAPTDVWTAVQPLCLAAAMLGQPAPVGAQALSTVRVILLQVDALRSILRARPALSAPFLDHSLQETLALTRAVVDLKLRSAAQRLAEYLLGRLQEPEMRPARCVLPIEKRLLAAKLGCSQENLSRAFAALRRVGVQTQGAVVIVNDAGRLRDLAQSRRRQARLTPVR